LRGAFFCLDADDWRGLKVWGGAPGTPNLPNDVSGAVIMKTLLGPSSGGASIGDSDHRKWFFGLGRVF